MFRAYTALRVREQGRRGWLESSRSMVCREAWSLPDMDFYFPDDCVGTDVFHRFCFHVGHCTGFCYLQG